jgi:VIT1/CCC1 family predicted Fe2+/Mn2+ transporter
VERLLDVLAVCSVLLFLNVLRGLRGSRIRVEYSVSWLAAAVVVFALSRSWGVLLWVAGFLQVKEPAVALIIMILLVFLAVFYRFSIIISHLKDMNITLTQKVAMLDYQLRSLHGHAKETAQD